MLIIFGLMLVLLQTVSCEDRICSFIETKPCFAALEGKLCLQMIQDNDISKLHLLKENNTICRIVKDKIVKFGLYNRSDVFLSNGIVTINNVTRAEAGNYTLELYDSQGTLKSTGLQVNVEAPVGSVNVSVKCNSGVRWANCSSEGDSLFFNWTLNGQPLPQEYKTPINLIGNTSGNLICSVKNHISHGEKSITVDHCPGTTTTSVTSTLNSTVTNSKSAGTSLSASNLTLTQNSGLLASLKLETNHLIAMASSIVILILLVITVCYIYKKKKQPKSAAAADGGTELVYADINHDKLNRDNKPKKTEMSSAADVEYAEVANQRKTKKKKMKEDEVQYGEVTFTPGGRNVQKQRMEQDDCVYSQIYQQK